MSEGRDDTKKPLSSGEAFRERLRRETRAMKRAAPDIAPRKRPPAPCHGQTAESIEAWLREHVREGAEVVIRETQYRQLRYTRAAVTSLGKGRFRVVTLLANGAHGGEVSFYYSGKHCFHPKGQTRLVIPTEAVLAEADGAWHWPPRGETNASASPFDEREMTVF